MLGQALYSGRWVIDDIGADAFEPGDVVVHNDPYRGGSHMPEHLLVAPFFHDGELRGYVGHDRTRRGDRRHGARLVRLQRHRDLPGGPAAAAGQARAAPASRCTRSGGSCSPTTARPRRTWGDFNAMIGALHVGLARLEALYEEHGADA